jgi:hypothetical protein
MPPKTVPRKGTPFQSATAALAIPGALFALGAGMISQSFRGAVGLMTASLPLFWLMLYHAYSKAQRTKRHFGVLASVVIYDVNAGEKMHQRAGVKRSL